MRVARQAHGCTRPGHPASGPARVTSIRIASHPTASLRSAAKTGRLPWGTGWATLEAHHHRRGPVAGLRVRLPARTS
jgi:hypothetical protein